MAGKVVGAGGFRIIDDVIFSTAIDDVVRLAIPDLPGGSRPEWVMIVASNENATDAFFLPGSVTLTCDATTGVPLPPGRTVFVNIRGATDIAVNSVTPDDTLSIFPVEI